MSSLLLPQSRRITLAARTRVVIPSKSYFFSLLVERAFTLSLCGGGGCSRYLSEEEVLDPKNPFVQLVSGVVWLLRDGRVYINESEETECEETQETGGVLEGKLPSVIYNWGPSKRAFL